MSLRTPPARLRAPRPTTVRRPAQLVVCAGCGLEAWQVSRDGRQFHCRACADGLAALDDIVLYWPACGHPSEDGEALYDRPVCVICETG